MDNVKFTTIMTDSQKIKHFFTAKLLGCEFCRMDIYSIELIEKMADMPPTTLFKFLKGYKDRGIKKQLGKLVPVLEMLGYKKAP